MHHLDKETLRRLQLGFIRSGIIVLILAIACQFLFGFLFVYFQGLPRQGTITIFLMVAYIVLLLSGTIQTARGLGCPKFILVTLCLLHLVPVVSWIVSISLIIAGIKRMRTGRAKLAIGSGSKLL